MHFYDFVSYCGMLADRKRLDAYARALKEVVKEDSIVLDLGAGTGIFSFLACEYGARKVYAVEPNPMIRLLSEVAAARGYGDRLEIIQKMSADVELGEKATVMVSDMHGAFPLHESSIETIIDARERLLADGGVVIPSRERIFFAVSESAKIYKKNVLKFLGEFEGFRIPSADRLVTNRWFSAREDGERLLSQPGMFADIDLNTISQTSFAANLRLEIESEGIAHGLRGWFENVLCGDIGLSNSLESKDITYSMPFFPFPKAVELKQGDAVFAAISASYQSGEYVWSWRTEIRRGEEQIERFDQSMLAALVVDPKEALRRNEFFSPLPSEEGKIDGLILGMMDGESMSGDIADKLLESFPERFDSFDAALERVFSVTRRYSD